MKKNLAFIATAFMVILVFYTEEGVAKSSYGDIVDTYCASRNVTPYGGNCNLCHSSNYSSTTQDMTNYLNGNYDSFCPATEPTCTDNDKDGYSVEGGDCGPIDCNDSNKAINPGAAENCTDKIDNNCNGLVDALDFAAVACPPVCTDNDGDGYSVEGGECGPVDCDDSDVSTNPGEAEVCGDDIDNNCDGLVDTQDTTVCEPPVVCADADGDGYLDASCGGDDCNDANAAINPGALEACGDSVDNNCNSVVDENCTTEITCTDSDGDGYSAEGGECGLEDCDDTNAEVNPGATEDCSDGIDNNCNSLVDTQDSAVCETPATCTDADGDTYAVEGGECGPIDCDDTDAFNSPGSVEFRGDKQDNDCDGLVDECTDEDGDTYLDADCGGADCDDTDPAINPGAEEILDNGIDENCNGMSGASA